VKKPVKKVSIKKASLKKSIPKDVLEKMTPIKPIKDTNVMLDTVVAVAVARSIATTSAAAFLSLSADVTPPAAVCRVAITGLGSVYTAPDDDTVPNHSESESDNDDEDVDDDDNDVVVQGGVPKPLKQVDMAIPRLVVASLYPVLAQALSEEHTDMGVSDILAKPLSPGSAWMGEILESLGTSDSQGGWLHNGEIANSVDCRDAVFDRDVDMEALAQEDAYHNVSAFWDEALDYDVDIFDDPLESTILLKRKEEQLRGVETKELDFNFVANTHTDHKKRQVVALMIVLFKEDAPLNELPDMVPNDRYIGEDGAEPQFV
jgi:hypothetical protein